MNWKPKISAKDITVSVETADSLFMKNWCREAFGLHICERAVNYLRITDYQGIVRLCSWIRKEVGDGIIGKLQEERSRACVSRG